MKFGSRLNDLFSCLLPAVVLMTLFVDVPSGFGCSAVIKRQLVDPLNVQL